MRPPPEPEVASCVLQAVVQRKTEPLKLSNPARKRPHCGMEILWHTIALSCELRKVMVALTDRHGDFQVEEMPGHARQLANGSVHLVRLQVLEHVGGEDCVERAIRKG